MPKGKRSKKIDPSSVVREGERRRFGKKLMDPGSVLREVERAISGNGRKRKKTRRKKPLKGQREA